jgi:divalent metal cation (Fe/Co/Zn/Cd) transporter
MAADSSFRTLHLRRGIALEYLTVGWNAIEGLIAITSGAAAGSVALLSFGIDSVLETSSGAVLLWRLRSEHHGANAEVVERRALKLVGASFLLLAVYVAVDSTKSLLFHDKPDRSAVGIALAVLSLIVMPWLARQKRKAAGHLNSRALAADSRQSSLCACLSAILLGGLALNASLGWWWADPTAALIMVPIIAREGWQAASGKSCCEC